MNIKFELNIEQYGLLLSSLEWTQRAFENYKYPTNEIKMERINQVKNLRHTLREAKEKNGNTDR